MSELEKAILNLTKSGFTAKEMIEKLAQIQEQYSVSIDTYLMEMHKEVERQREDNQVMDGYIGNFKGHEVYLEDSQLYFEEKDWHDDKDVYWKLTAQNGAEILVHRGKVIGTVSGKTVTGVPSTDVMEYFPARKEKQRVARLENMKQKLDAGRRGNPTAGSKKVVAQRHSVEYYMEHTIELLNEGAKYGERSLQKLSDEGSSKAESLTRGKKH